MDGFISKEKIPKLTKACNYNHEIYDMLMDKNCRWNSNIELAFILSEERCRVLNLIVEIDNALYCNYKSDFFKNIMCLYEIDFGDVDKVKEKLNELKKTSKDLEEFINFIKEY